MNPPRPKWKDSIYTILPESHMINTWPEVPGPGGWLPHVGPSQNQLSRYSRDRPSQSRNFCRAMFAVKKNPNSSIQEKMQSPLSLVSTMCRKGKKGLQLNLQRPTPRTQTLEITPNIPVYRQRTTSRCPPSKQLHRHILSWSLQQFHSRITTFSVSLPICVGQGTKETASQRSCSWPVQLQLTSEFDYQDLDTSAFPPAQPSGLPEFYSTTKQRVDWFNHYHISPKLALPETLPFYLPFLGINL